MHLDAKNKVEWSFKRKKKRKKSNDKKKIHDNVPWFEKEKRKRKKEKKEKKRKKKREKTKQTIPDGDLPSPNYQKEL